MKKQYIVSDKSFINLKLKLKKKNKGLRFTIFNSLWSNIIVHYDAVCSMQYAERSMHIYIWCDSREVFQHVSYNL